MNSASAPPVSVRPLPEPVSQLQLLRAILRNSLEAVPAAAYTQPLARRRFLGREVIYVTDPELIRQVLVEQESSFVKAETTRRVLVPALGQGLLTAEGAHWRWQRRAAAPAFRHDRLLGFMPAMLAAAGRTRDRWLALPAGGTVEVAHEMMRTTYDVIVETMLSDAAGLDQAGIEQAIAAYLGSAPWAVMAGLFGLPGWLPLPRRRQGRRAREYVRDALLGIVRRRRGGQGGVDGGRPDLLTLLLDAHDPEDGRAMSDQEAADNLLTFIVAGHETTALTLTWSLYLLACHPEAEARIVQEVGRVTGGGPIGAGHVADLAYTRQVVQEAMRLYPPAAMVARMAVRDVRLGGLAIPAGTPTNVPIYAVHRHAALWREPDAFDPDRFLPEAVADRHRYAYLPFGAGPRICIGASFAMLEAVAVLATLVQAFRPVMAPGPGPVPRLRITLRPQGGVRMVMEPRMMDRADPSRACCPVEKTDLPDSL